jgi:hypothetical protein
MPQYSFRDADTASFKKLNNKISSRKSKQVSEKSGGILHVDSEFSEESIRKIVNTREELKKEEDIIQEKTFDQSILENKTLLKSSSEVLLRDSQRLYDLSDFGN